MLSTICTVNRSIPTSRLRTPSWLTICLSLLCASPALLHAAPLDAEDTPTDAASISASVFLYVPFHSPDTSAATAPATATATATEGNKGINAETTEGDEGWVSGSAVPDAVSVADSYLEEQSGAAGFALLAPYLG